MLKAVLCKDGHCVSDFYACDFADSKIYEYAIVNGADIEVRFANEAVLDAFVLRVMQDKFPASEIEFYFEETKLEFDECLGLIIPDDMDDFGIHYEMTNKILKLGYAKMKIKQVKEKGDNK